MALQNWERLRPQLLKDGLWFRANFYANHREMAEEMAAALSSQGGVVRDYGVSINRWNSKTGEIIVWEVREGEWSVWTSVPIPDE